MPDLALDSISSEKITRPIVRRRWNEVCRGTQVNPFEYPYEWKMLKNSWVARYMWRSLIRSAMLPPTTIHDALCLSLQLPYNAIILLAKDKRHDAVVYVDDMFYIVNSRYLVDPMCLSLTDPKEMLCMLVRDFVDRNKEMRWM